MVNVKINFLLHSPSPTLAFPSAGLSLSSVPTRCLMLNELDFLAGGSTVTPLISPSPFTQVTTASAPFTRHPGLPPSAVSRRVVKSISGADIQASDFWHLWSHAAKSRRSHLRTKLGTKFTIFLSSKFCISFVHFTESFKSIYSSIDVTVKVNKVRKSFFLSLLRHCRWVRKIFASIAARARWLRGGSGDWSSFLLHRGTLASLPTPLEAEPPPHRHTSNWTSH